MNRIRDMIDRWFSDTSRTVAETREGLESLREQIDMLLETLEGES